MICLHISGTFVISKQAYIGSNAMHSHEPNATGEGKKAAAINARLIVIAEPDFESEPCWQSLWLDIAKLKRDDSEKEQCDVEKA